MRPNPKCKAVCAKVYTGLVKAAQPEVLGCHGWHEAIGDRVRSLSIDPNEISGRPTVVRAMATPPDHAPQSAADVLAQDCGYFFRRAMAQDVEDARRSRRR
jgi:hypothetical protein